MTTDDGMTAAALYGLHARDDEVAKLKAEIERLRADLDDQRKDTVCDEQRIADLMADVQRLGAEIERLRGLLRECDAALEWQGHNGTCLDKSFNDYEPDCPECRLLMRVREALSDE